MAFDSRFIPIIASSRCTGCGLCIQVCMTGTLMLVNLKAVVAHAESCTYDASCELACPTQAIQLPLEIEAS